MITLLDNYTTEQLKALALEIIADEDFKVCKKENGKLALIDSQGANLGDIEDDEFDDLADILDRLEIYHNDYFFEDINDCCNGILNKFDTIEQFVEYAQEHLENEFKAYKFEIEAIALIVHYYDKLKGVTI